MNARVDALHRPNDELPLRNVSLDDKYTAVDGDIYLSGVQSDCRSCNDCVTPQRA